ncbi:hypothetical protein [Pelobacter seleniigenes]|uniref:hypothetical protein n=1 Tax=Pelobacter seleniigenes TaxID=407188 RepID=UPI0004A78175|nr:hypothetical protein [Pelobacter seleniigenes]
MTRMLLLIILVSTWAAAGWTAPLSAADPAEQVVRRVVVPAVDQPQAEVQIVRRGPELLVRTVIFSPILRRVVAAIDEKEAKRWPEESAGFVESQRYREQLYAATETVRQRFAERPDPAQSRQALVIEFIRSKTERRISLLLPQLAGEFGSLHIRTAEVLQNWRSRGDYVDENMLEIVHDSFHMDRSAASVLLAAIAGGEMR